MSSSFYLMKCLTTVYGNYYFVVTLLQHCKVLTILSQGYGFLCKVFASLQSCNDLMVMKLLLK